MSATWVEFPMLGRLDTNILGYFLVNTHIDAGANYLDIGFVNAGSGVFAAAYRNTFVFTFATDVIGSITSAVVNATRTALAA